MRYLICVLGVLLIASTAAAEVPQRGEFRGAQPERVVELGSTRIPQTIEREEALREREETHAWLMSEQVVAGIENPLAVELTVEELEDIEFGAYTRHLRTPEAQRIGIAKQVFAELVLRSPRWGEARSTFEGGRVWSGAVKSMGAYGLRVHFDNFWLPGDTELYMFNASGEVFGPYTEAGPLGTGEFWSHTITGEVAYLQLRQYGAASPSALDDTYFDIVDIGHVSGAFGARFSDVPTKTFCTYNEDCVENVSCVDADPAVADARTAVAHMQYVKRPYLYICSGGLINSEVDNGHPYFLTANHCINRDREAGTLEAYFFYVLPCGGDCPAQWSEPVTERTLGSSVVVTNKTGDYTLLQLSEAAPGGTTLLGWSTEPVAFKNGANLYRISHPSGAPQAYSEHSVDTSAPTCSSWPRGSWIYSRDTLGATEGGSSGSPVVNSEGLIVGQLSGACGTNLNDNCDAVNNATVDGAFASYFAEVAPYLELPGECNDADGDGYGEGSGCLGADCNDDNVNVNPGETEVCDNGYDDDCDGLIDENDPDCAECVATGGDCTSNSDCCSLRCHPRKLTCK